MQILFFSQNIPYFPTGLRRKTNLPIVAYSGLHDFTHLSSLTAPLCSLILNITATLALSQPLVCAILALSTGPLHKPFSCPEKLFCSPPTSKYIHIFISQWCHIHRIEESWSLSWEEAKEDFLKVLGLWSDTWTEWGKEERKSIPGKETTRTMEQRDWHCWSQNLGQLKGDGVEVQGISLRRAKRVKWYSVVCERALQGLRKREKE